MSEYPTADWPIYLWMYETSIPNIYDGSDNTRVSVMFAIPEDKACAHHPALSGEVKLVGNS